MTEDEVTALYVFAMFVGGFILAPLAIYLFNKIIEKIFKP